MIILIFGCVCDAELRCSTSSVFGDGIGLLEGIDIMSGHGIAEISEVSVFGFIIQLSSDGLSKQHFLKLMRIL